MTDQLNQQAEGGRLVWTIPYRPPFLWDKLLAFWKGRAIQGVEKVDEGRYIRTVRLEGTGGDIQPGWFSLENEPDHNRLRVCLPGELAAFREFLDFRIRHMFDLDSDPLPISRQLVTMNRIKPGLFLPGTRVPGVYDPFEMAVRAVLGQQITVKAAQTLAGRLATRLGGEIATPFPDLNRTFPEAGCFADLGEEITDLLGPLGVTGRRSLTIGALARLVREEDQDFWSAGEMDSKLKKLMAIGGIGPWTAHYIAMRAMRWDDAFPGSDYGVKKVLAPRNQKEIHALAESWRPYRAYAVAGIWNSL